MDVKDTVIEPALVVDEADNAPWDETTDVLVVGLGAAGCSTALQARAQNVDLLAVDRFFGGGATAISGGIVYAGGGTHIQQEAGVQDTVDDMFNYLSMEVQGAVSDATLRDFCKQSAANVAWLCEHGVPFKGTLSPVKTSYPADPYFLYMSGNEAFVPYSDHAKPVARGHRTVGGAFPGANLAHPLIAACQKAGVETRFQSRVTRLIVDPQGAVVGAELKTIRPGLSAWAHRWMHALETKIDNYIPPLANFLNQRCTAIENSAATTRVRCRRGVVLCAGGFIYNRAMVAQYAPKYLPGLPLGTTADDGTGIRLGQSAGGAVDRMSRISAWRFLYPPDAFANGILINSKGERFCNEFWYGSKIAEAMCEDNDSTATLILNAHLKRLAHKQARTEKLQWFQKLVAYANLYGNCIKARDVVELARTIGVNAGRAPNHADQTRHDCARHRARRVW